MLVKQPTMLTNAIRGQSAEFGPVVKIGRFDHGVLVNASRIRRTRNARRPFPGDRGVAEDHHELQEMVE